MSSGEKGIPSEYLKFSFFNFFVRGPLITRYRQPPGLTHAHYFDQVLT